MTISKGAPWGSPAAGPPAVVVATDAALRALVEQGVAVTVGLTGGDLCRTLGGRGALAMAFPVDVVRVEGGGGVYRFVSHLVCRSRAWTRTTAAMNAAWLGGWNPAPKAHPNDGLVDVVRARLRVGDLRAVRSRLAQGAHLPHPRITVERSRTVSLRLAGRVFLDGEAVSLGGDVVLTVEPDALTVVV